MNNIVMEQEVMGEEHRATETGEQICEDDQVTWVIREDDHTDHLDYPDHTPPGHQDMNSPVVSNYRKQSKAPAVMRREWIKLESRVEQTIQLGRRKIITLMSNQTVVEGVVMAV